METLQLAQMLADLGDLNAADPRAAHALVSANKTITDTAPPSTTQHLTSNDAAVATPTDASSAEPIPGAPLQRPQHRRISSSSALAPNSFPSGAGSTASAPRNNGTASPFDSYLGRRLLTPPITRSSSSHGSMPGTPRGGEADSDIERASSLIALYELRAKLKQYNDSSSLRQAREKIAALSARQQQQQQQQQQQPHASERSGTPISSPTGPAPTSAPSQQPPPMARRHSHYSYPRS